MPTKSNDIDTCYFCCDSITYSGILKLYTEYNSINAILSDYKERYYSVDSLYLECIILANKTEKQLIETDLSRDGLLIDNGNLKKENIKLETQKKRWRIFGVGSTATLLGIIILIL